MKIKKEDTVAIVVDIQERLFPHIADHEALTQNVLKLIAGLKILDVPLIVTEQYPKGIGHTIAPVQEAVGAYQAIEKMAFSCCGEAGFREALANLGKRHVILMGIESHVCVMQTALDLLVQKYVPVLVTDCVGSRSPYNKEIAIQRMASEGVIMATYESILFELCETSGTDAFKAISRLVK